MERARMNFATFDLNLLRVFQALLRERSVTRAGDRLALSQPAVSAALARLRHALGDELFIRQGNTMVPTARAQAIAAPVADALAAVEAALTREAGFDPAAEARMFTLYGADFFSNLLMPLLYARIAGLAPGIVLRLVDNARGDLVTLLGDGVCDLTMDAPAVVPDWVASEMLFDSPFVMAAPRGMAVLASVAEGDAVPLDLFCALPHALRSVDGSLDGFGDAALARVGRRRRVVLALPHFQSVCFALARAGEAGRDLVALLPAQYARAMAPVLGLALYAPPLDVPVPRIGQYWHRRRDSDPAHRWLRAQVAAEVARLA
jgi:DNA-binding transcriptional LysR family regulator